MIWLAIMIGVDVLIVGFLFYLCWIAPELPWHD
jgi:hypothetical protein